MTALRLAQRLQTLVGENCQLPDYPTVLPFNTLQTILYNIYQRNQLRGYSGGINDISMSATLPYIATAGTDGMARIWTISGQQIGQWQATQGEVTSISFNPKTAHLATADNQGKIKVWQGLGQLLTEWVAHRNPVRIVRFSPDGQSLASTGDDGVFKLWNLSGQEIFYLEHTPGVISSISFSPNGEYIAIAGNELTVRLLNSAAQTTLQLKGNKSVTTVCFTPSTTPLLTAEIDGAICFWDLTGNLLGKFNSHQGSVSEYGRPSIRSIFCECRGRWNRQTLEFAGTKPRDF